MAADNQWQEECDWIGAVTWEVCNQITGRRKTTILFQHTILLRNPDGAAKENGLILFPNNRLQRLSNICFFHIAMVGVWEKSFGHWCWELKLVLGRSSRMVAALFYICLLTLVPFTSLFALFGKSKPARSLKSKGVRF